ncbi:hypothetical protein Tco_1542364, partial [Tanacetum coccineum]
SPNYVPGPEHPPSPDYVPGPKHPPSPVEVPYVPEPEYPEYLVPSDVKAPLEDQPLPTDASPTALSPSYVADSDPEEDPKEDHADYPADGGDGDDEPFDDDDDEDTDDEDEEPFEDEDDDEEEEEHLALADSSAIPVIRIPFAQRLRRARKTVRLEPPMSPSMKARIAEYAVAPTPPSPLSPWKDILEAELPPRKRLCLTAPTSRYEVGESSTAAPRPTGGHRTDYRLIGTMDADIRHQEALVSREAWAHSIGLSSAVHYKLQAYRTHTQMQDYCIASQESLMTILITHVSSLQGQFSAALGQIQALQARDQTHADDREDTGSSA